MPAVQLEHAHCLSAGYSDKGEEQTIEDWPVTSHQGRSLGYILLPCTDFRFPSMFPLLPYLPSQLSHKICYYKTEETG